MVHLKLKVMILFYLESEMLRMWRMTKNGAASANVKHFHIWANTKSWCSTSSVPFSKTIWSLMLRLVPKWSWRALLFVFKFVSCFGSVFRFQKLERHDTHRAKWVQIHNLIHTWFHRIMNPIIIMSGFHITNIEIRFSGSFHRRGHSRSRAG